MRIKTLTIRIRFSTLKKIKRIFPAKRGESLASYFERLQERMDEVQFYHD